MMIPEFDFELGDPYILGISAHFVEGYEREMRKQNQWIEALDNPTLREAVAAGDPEFSEWFEAQTKEDLEARKSMMAMSIGVAFAIKHALQSHKS